MVDKTPHQVSGFIASETMKTKQSVCRFQLSPRLRCIGILSVLRLRSFKSLVWSFDGKASMTPLRFAAILCSLRFDVESTSCVFFSKSKAASTVDRHLISGFSRFCPSDMRCFSARGLLLGSRRRGFLKGNGATLLLLESLCSPWFMIFMDEAS